MLAHIPATSLLLLMCLLLTERTSHGLDNGLARRPPMGWLAWQRFTCETDCLGKPHDCVHERLFLEMAQRLVDDGYLAAGYQYVNIDDCWSEPERGPSPGPGPGATGQDGELERPLVADRGRFPHGIQWLAQQLHSRGLKLGIYGDCGLRTCAGYPSQLASESNYSRNYFRVDAKTLARWQVDSLKLDGCYIDPLRAERACPSLSGALNATSRPMLLMCEWPFYMMYAHAEPDFSLAAASCNSWRYYDDIEDSWQSVLNTLDYTIRHQSTIVRFHGPGHWFDPDQLVIGNFGLSLAQARAQLALWSIWSAPLYMGNDLRSIGREFRELLTNGHLLAVDQDRLGVFGLMVQQSADRQLQAFVKPVEPVDAASGCPSFAIVYLNRRTLGNKIKVAFKLFDLLRLAPLRQAAKNQQQELLQQSTAAGSDALVKPDECLAQLMKQHQLGQQQPQPQSQDQDQWPQDETGAAAATATTRLLEFEYLDLIQLAPNGQPAKLGQLNVSSQLELEVAPSSVRAIKLVQVQVTGAAN